MKTRLIPILLILALLLGMVPAMAAEPELKGDLGDNLAWELEPVEGVLTLTGEGAIPDFSYSDGAPWYPYRSRIFKGRALVPLPQPHLQGRAGRENHRRRRLRLQ